MLDVLEKHLHAEPKLCVVATWISALKDEEQKAFSQIQENRDAINISVLFKDLSGQIKLPFKLTAFRSHIRGYCTCQR